MDTLNMIEIGVHLMTKLKPTGFLIEIKENKNIRMTGVKTYEHKKRNNLK